MHRHQPGAYACASSATPWLSPRPVLAVPVASELYDRPHPERSGVLPKLAARVRFPSPAPLLLLVAGATVLPLGLSAERRTLDRGRPPRLRRECPYDVLTVVRSGRL